MDKKYIVGIDFGFCKTAAWCAPIQGVDDGWALCLRRGAHANDKMCPSIVYRNNEGCYSLNWYSGYVSVYSFKECLEKLNLNPYQKDAYTAFIRLIINALIENNPELVFDPQTKKSNFHIGIACSNYWSDADRLEYQAFFIRALEEFQLQPICVISEGLAAYYSQGRLSDSTLVIDYGPNTICYTLLKDGKVLSNRDWYNPALGASQVERAILDDYIDKNKERFYKAMNAIVEECHRTGNPYSYDDVYSYLLDDIRVAKEYVFRDGHWPFMNRMLFDTMFYKCGGYASGYDDSTFGTISIGGSLLEMPSFVDYQKKVKSDFENIKSKTEALVGTTGLKSIIMAGESSLMPWVRSVVMEVFGNKVKVVMDNPPSYTVARGISKYVQRMIFLIFSCINKFLFIYLPHKFS